MKFRFLYNLIAFISYRPAQHRTIVPGRMRLEPSSPRPLLSPELPLLWLPNTTTTTPSSYLQHLEKDTKTGTRSREKAETMKRILQQRDAMKRAGKKPSPKPRPRPRRNAEEEDDEEDEESIIIPVRESVFDLLFRPQNLSLGGYSSPRRASKSSSQKSSDEGNFHLEEVRGEYNFSRVGGYHEVKDEMSQVLDFIAHPENYTQYGVRVPRGLLLEGPTGNGKTLLAKCLAGEAGMNFVSCSGAQFNEKYVGVGASRVRELFKFAEENKPCILFIDEIDALGRRRSGEGESGAERDQTLNQLLVLMDGFSSSSGDLLVVGATNRIDILDKAFIRPGRIDKVIHVPNPDAETRKDILGIHMKNKPLNVTADYLVRLTNGLNGAQMENLLNEAVLFSIRNRSLPVTTGVLDFIKEKIIVGQTSGSKKTYTPQTMKRIAVHEIGHLVMALDSDHYERPWKVTIDSMNPKNSLGYTIFESDDMDDGIFIREYFEDKLKVLLGGRVAEEVFYGDSISSGALSDLESAFSMAKKMVMEYGMGTDIIYPYFSETYKKRIDEQIHFLIIKAYKATQVYLEKNKDFIDKFAEELILRKTMNADDIQEFYALHKP